MRNECMKSKLHFNRPLPVEDVVTSLSESNIFKKKKKKKKILIYSNFKIKYNYLLFETIFI